MNQNQTESKPTTPEQPTGEGLDETTCSPFRFEIGKTYETQAGNMVTVLGRTPMRGYECLECSDERYRYDRSTSSSDAGRVTGTPHDYSYPHNFKRENVKCAGTDAGAQDGKHEQ